MFVKLIFGLRGYLDLEEHSFPTTTLNKTTIHYFPMIFQEVGIKNIEKIQNGKSI